MFGLFKKKTPLRKLEDRYEKLIKMSYDLSTIDRAKSDMLAAEANDVANQIDQLRLDEKSK